MQTFTTENPLQVEGILLAGRWLSSYPDSLPVKIELRSS
jgi:hypothetical protein